MSDDRMSEAELVRRARELGRGGASELDPERIAALVSRRLQERSIPPVRPAVIRWTIGLAAAALLAVAVGTRGGRPDPAAAEPALVALHELDGLTPAELLAVLETIPPPADSAIHVEAAPIDELSAEELERVLRTLE